MKKLIAVILCAALLLSMAACSQVPTESTATVPTEPPAKDVYTQARDALNSLSDVTLDLLITTVTTVDGDVFSEQSAQTLTYQARGTEDAAIFMEEALKYGVHDDNNGEDEDDLLAYTEVWYQETLYAELDKTYRYRGSVDTNTAADRYTPVVLLDPELYGGITSETSEGGTRIRFTEPIAGESWALPQESEFAEASGSALVNENGNLAEMNYTVTYTYGPALITTTVQSKPLDTPKSVAVPTDPDAYTSISYIDAIRIYVRAISNLMQIDSLTLHNSESLFSEAAAVARNQSIQTDLHGRKENTIAKLDTSVSFMDYSTMENEEYYQEETFLNGKLTTVVNNGLPSTNGSISWETVRAYIAELITYGMLDMDFWEDVTATDMGSVWLLEYKLNENFGNTTQNGICDMLWGDPSFLIKLASNYQNAELNGYLSIDRYTGLPVAAGYSYKGVHTIEGHDYAMTLQFDQSIESPSKGAYQAITDKRPPEEEPEAKPTPLFYHVTGKNGQQMWLFGTIHVGDARTAYLPEEIRNAFVGSDALALECNTELFDEQLEEDHDLAQQVSSLYFYTDGTEFIKNTMNADDFAYAEKLLKAIGGNNSNMPYAKPYVWSNLIQLFYLRQGYQLHSDQGVEARLLDWAEELNKNVLEIESNLAQIQMTTGFSNELQMLLLEEMLQYDAQKYWEDSMDLYELWCAGNEDDLRNEIANEWDYGELTEAELAKYKPLIEEYHKAMSLDRNEGMLEAAIDYLESGKVIFYAVGLAHLLDDTNGLVNALQKAGYTVERVYFES